MAFIEWNDSFSVNITEIDNQHKKLVEMINELYEAMKTGSGKDVLGGLVVRLAEYTVTHFATEEKYFKQFQYPDTGAHTEEHALFVQKVGEFRTDFEAGKIGVSVALMNFLSGWLKNHIKGSDQKYSSFFVEHGLK